MPGFGIVVSEVILKCLPWTLGILATPERYSNHMKGRSPAAMPQNGVVIADRDVNRYVSSALACRLFRTKPGDIVITNLTMLSLVQNRAAGSL